MPRSVIPEPWRAPVEEYTNYSIAAGQEPRTIELRVYQLGRFARAHPTGPASVTPSHVLKHVARADWALNTRIVVRNSLTSFFRWAQQNELVVSDPTTSLPPMPVAASNTQPASREVIRAALAKATPRVNLMIRLAADAGLSAMEIATVRKRDIQEHDGDYAIRTQGKAQTVRLLPLPPGLAEDLLSLPGDYAFPGDEGGPMTPAYISRLVSKPLPAGVSSVNLNASFASSGAAVRLASWRETGFHSPADAELLAQAEVSDMKSLHRSFRRIERFLDSDPGTAISECKNIVEALAKRILDDLGQLPAGRPDMKQLNESLAIALGLPDASVPGDTAASTKVAEHIQSSFRAVTDLRNALGTGHGGTSAVPESRHARLAFNTTVSVTEFLVSAWQEVKRA